MGGFESITQWILNAGDSKVGLGAKKIAQTRLKSKKR